MEINPTVMLSLIIIALVSVGGTDFNEIYLDAMNMESGGDLESVLVVQEKDEIRFHVYDDGIPGGVKFRARVKQVKDKDFPVFIFYGEMENSEDEITVDLTDYTTPQARQELKELFRPEISLMVNEQVEVSVLRRGQTAYIQNDMTPEVVIAVHR